MMMDRSVHAGDDVAMTLSHAPPHAWLSHFNLRLFRVPRLEHVLSVFVILICSPLVCQLLSTPASSKHRIIYRLLHHRIHSNITLKADPQLPQPIITMPFTARYVVSPKAWSLPSKPGGLLARHTFHAWKQKSHHRAIILRIRRIYINLY